MYFYLLGISLVKKSEMNGRSLEVDNSETAENQIPENSADFGKQVDSMLYEKLSRFARSRSLQLSMPQMFDEGRDLDDGVYLTGNVLSTRALSILRLKCIFTTRPIFLRNIKARYLTMRTDNHISYVIISKQF